MDGSGGRIILLNGTSSSGKTTLVRALHPLVPLVPPGGS
jgi:chloramphenicol 3-O-phosphotransferase